jgi:hypothetical protein
MAEMGGMRGRIVEMSKRPTDRVFSRGLLGRLLASV